MSMSRFETCLVCVRRIVHNVFCTGHSPYKLYGQPSRRFHNQVGDVTKTAHVTKNIAKQNVAKCISQKTKTKKCLHGFRIGYEIFDLVVGPFLGYNTKSVALAGFANIYAITYKHCTQNAFCRNMYKRLSHINCMGNQVEDFTTNSKVALAFPTCAPCLWERLEISLIKSL
jgi:hypothetical protein